MDTSFIDTSYLPTHQQLEKAICERSFYDFFLRSWPTFEQQTPFIDNWHIKYLCDVLQAEIERIAEGKERKKSIIINVPPRSLKSDIGSVCLPAWAWTKYPHIKTITASYAASLAKDLAVKSRGVLESDWYRAKWGNTFQFSQDQNEKIYFKNDKGGHRISLGVDGATTGKGADIIIIDDPQDPKTANSEKERENVMRWWDQTISTRLNDARMGVFIVIMQRLHDQDLTGYILDKTPDDFIHICIPSEINNVSKVSPKILEKYYEKGLFFRNRFDKKVLDGHKKRLGSKGYANQFYQSSAPDDGIIFNTSWFTKRWTILPAKMEWSQHWDLTFKETKEGSFVVGQTWGRKGSMMFLIDEFRKRMDYVATKKAIRWMKNKYPDTGTIWIEDKANGPAIISELGDEIPGIKPFPKKDSKEAMAHAATPFWEAGNIYLPNEPWVDEWIEEHRVFPNGRYDDRVDMSSQAIATFGHKRKIWW